MALPSSHRLKKPSDFSVLFKNSKRIKGSFLSILLKEKKDAKPKIGIIVSSKTASRAVDRNRLKRILTEELRKNIKLNSFSSDMVIIINKKGEEEAIKKELALFLNKIQSHHP